MGVLVTKKMIRIALSLGLVLSTIAPEAGAAVSVGVQTRRVQVGVNVGVPGPMQVGPHGVPGVPGVPMVNPQFGPGGPRPVGVQVRVRAGGRCGRFGCRARVRVRGGCGGGGCAGRPQMGFNGGCGGGGFGQCGMPSQRNFAVVRFGGGCGGGGGGMVAFGGGGGGCGGRRCF